MTERRRSDDEEIPDEVMGAHIDDGPGSAAFSTSEDWVRANSSPEDHDGRAPTRTYFNARDAPGKYPPWQADRKPREKRSWAKLASWQDGANSDISRGGQNWWADKQRWIETFSDQMGATKYHKTRAKHILETIDLTSYQAGRISVEAVIVGILSLLIDSDINDFEKRAYKRDETQELMESLEMELDDYEHIRKLLKKNHGDVIFPE